MAGSGYGELKKVAFFGVAFSESVLNSTKASTKLGKAAAFLTSFDEAASLLSLDGAALKDEFENMHEADWQGLLKETAAHFSITDADLEPKVEASVNLGFQLLDLLRQGQAIWQKKA